MYIDAEEANLLTPWLMKSMEPICDAEPDKVTAYILALLKNEGDREKMGTYLNEQLDVFLQDETPKFVERLLDHLDDMKKQNRSESPPFASSSKRRLASPSHRSEPPKTARRSYDDGPSSRSPPPDGIPAPASGLLAGAPSAPAAMRKDGKDGDIERWESERRRSPDRRDRDRDRGEEGYGSRRGRGDRYERRRDGRDRDGGQGYGRNGDVGDRRNERRGMGPGPGPLPPQGFPPMANGMPPMQPPMMYGPPPGVNPAVPGGRAPPPPTGWIPEHLCRDYHVRGFCSRGDQCRLVHDDSPLTGLSLPPTSSSSYMVPLNGPSYLGVPPPSSNAHEPYDPSSSTPLPKPSEKGAGGDATKPIPSTSGSTPTVTPFPTSASNPMMQMPMPMPIPGAMMPDMASFGRGRGAPRGRGARKGDRGQFVNGARSDTTLVIENVPPESLKLDKVNEEFKKFGEVTNISIDPHSHKALVSYSHPREAHAAHSSPEVFFNNRFVKVYFKRLDDPAISTPVPQQPTVPAKPVDQPSMVTQTNKGSTSLVNADTAKKSSELKQLAEAHKEREAALKKQLEKERAMIEKSKMPAEEKAALLKTLDKALEEATAKVDAASSDVEKVATPAPPPVSEKQRAREQSEREKLDMELELHSAKAGGDTDDAENSHAKAKLEALRAEALAMGIDPHTVSSAAAAASGYVPRGRGRGRAAYRGGAVPFRGRGSYPYPARGRGRGMGAYSLDNRSTRLSVVGVPTDGDREKVEEYFRQFGDVDSFADADNNALIVHYRIRAAAEKALAKGNEIPEIGSVTMTWASAATSTATPQPEGTPQPPAGSKASTPAEVEDAPETEHDSGVGVVEENGVGRHEEEEEEEDRETSWRR